MKKLRDDATTPALKRLMHDHKRIRKLLKRAGRARGPSAEIAAEVGQACAALTEHAALEERWLYPALRGIARGAQATAEAEVAHGVIDQIASGLLAMDAGDERYLATVRVLRVLVEHHLADEEDRLFPLARARGVDLDGLADVSAEHAEAGTTGAAELPVDAVPSAHRVRPPHSPAERRQRARGPGRRGAH